MIFGLVIKRMLPHPIGNYDVHMVNAKLSKHGKYYQCDVVSVEPKVCSSPLWKV